MLVVGNQSSFPLINLFPSYPVTPTSWESVFIPLDKLAPAVTVDGWLLGISLHSP